MPYYTSEQIAKAREMDLLTYLRLHDPGELVHVSGGEYCTREHDSLKISNGKWNWWSRGFGGATALDYLIKVKGIPFIQAMGMILDGQANPYVHGETSAAVNTIALTYDVQLPDDMPASPDTGYELLSEEDVEKEIASREKEEDSINGEQK